MPRPVMADVARLAGVSHQTVSRVLNGHPNVSSATKANVLAAIRDLGYRPNTAARALVTGKTNVLGVISFDTTLYGPASMLYGIERAARPGHFVAIASLPSFDRGVADRGGPAVPRTVGRGNHRDRAAERGGRGAGRAGHRRSAGCGGLWLHRPAPF